MRAARNVASQNDLDALVERSYFVNLPDCWSNALSYFAVVKIAGISQESDRYLYTDLHRIDCEPIFCCGECEVPAPYGTTTKRMYRNVFEEIISLDEYFERCPFFYMSERAANELEIGMTILVPLGYQRYETETLVYAEDYAARRVSQARTHKETENFSFDDLPTEEAQALLYIPIVDGKLIYDENLILNFNANRFGALNKGLSRAREIHDAYAEKQSFGSIFYPEFFDMIPEATIQNGIELDDLIEIVGWYLSCQKEYGAYRTASLVHTERANRFVYSHTVFPVYDQLCSAKCAARIVSIENETIDANGVIYRKVICDALFCNAAGVWYTPTYTYRPYLRDYFKDRTELYIRDSEIGDYAPGDEVLFDPACYYCDGYCVLLIEDRMKSDEPFDLYGVDNLFLLTVRKAMEDGDDLSKCLFADMLDTLPNTVNENSSDHEIIEALLWLKNLRLLYSEIDYQYKLSHGIITGTDF